MFSWLQDWWSSDKPESPAPGGYVEPYLQNDQSVPSSLSADEKSSLQNTAFRHSRLILDGATTYEICESIKSYPHKHQLLNERDFYGYNALQYAVICAREDLVIEMIKLGADVNQPICGRPLHLACKLGHAQMVNTLLCHGADPQVMSCVCYPYHHRQEGFTYSSKQKKWSLSCGGDVFTDDHDSGILFDFPLYYAFLSHSVECVTLLLSGSRLGNHGNTVSPLRHSYPAHLLCEVGAMSILQHLYSVMTADSGHGIKMTTDSGHGIKMTTDSGHGIKMTTDTVHGIKMTTDSGHGIKMTTDTGHTFKMTTDTRHTCKMTTDPGHEMTINPGDKMTTDPGHRMTTDPGHRMTTDTGHKMTTNTGHEMTTDPGHGIKMTTDTRHKMTTDTGHKMTTDTGHKMTTDGGHKMTTNTGHEMTTDPGHGTKMTTDTGHKLTTDTGHKMTTDTGHKLTTNPGHEMTTDTGHGIKMTTDTGHGIKMTTDTGHKMTTDAGHAGDAGSAVWQTEDGWQGHHGDQSGRLPPITQTQEDHHKVSMATSSAVNWFDLDLNLDLNRFDSHGFTALHYAVRWGPSLVEYLVLKGANARVKSRREQTVLHVLYSSTLDRWLNCADNRDKKTHSKHASSSSVLAPTTRGRGLPPELPNDMTECTRYLLSCGLQVNINAGDLDGNSVLHCLLPLLHININSHDGAHADDSSQVWVSTVRECVQALLRAHVNPNKPNRTGHTSLHVLCTKPSPHQVSGDASAQISYCEKFSYNLPGIHIILEDLLEYGAILNKAFGSDVSAVDLFIENGVRRVFGQLPGKWRSPDRKEVGYLIACIKLFSCHGYQFDDHFRGQKYLQYVLNYITQIDLMVSCHPPGSPFGSTSDRAVVGEFVSALLDVVEALLECGCNPNAAKSVTMVTTDSGHTAQVNCLHLAYYLLMNRQAIIPLHLVHRSVLLFLKHGVDPNCDGEHVPLSVLRPHGNEVRSVFPLLHILNVIGCTPQPHSRSRQQALQRIFEVLYNSMDDTAARQCVLYYVTYDRLHMSRLWLPHAHTLLFGFYNLADNNADLGGVDFGGAMRHDGDDDSENAAKCRKCEDAQSEFTSLLSKILNNPRSLRQLSRLAVIKLLDRKLTTVPNLPLPSTLKTYITTYCM